MVKNKRFIILVLLFMFGFNVCLVKPKVANANISAGVVSSMVLESGIAGSSIIAIAPYVVAFATVCTGLGVVYNNKEEIKTMFVSVYNYAKSKGKNLLDYFSRVADKVILSAEGIGLISESIQNYRLSNDEVNVIGNIGTFPFYEGSYSEGAYTVSVDIPLIEEQIILKLSGTRVNDIVNARLKINGTALSKIGNMHDIFTSDRNIWVGITNIDGNMAYWYSRKSYEELISKMGNVGEGAIITGVAENNLNIFIENYTSYTGSLSVDRVMNDGIGELSGVDTIPVFKNPSISIDKDIAVSVPVDATWDMVVGKTDTTTLEYANVDTVEGVKPAPDNVQTVPDKIELDFTPLRINITDKFPFCIPFDFVDMVKSFSVEKERPVISVVFPEKYFNSYKLEIDLAFYDDYFPFSSILRYFILIGFVLFLVRNTRKLMGA